MSLNRNEQDLMDISKFEDILRRRQQELSDLTSMSADSRRAVELDQTKVGRLSRMDAMQQQEMAKASQQHRAAEMRRIEAALERIRDGDYGFCIDCGEPIAERRLEIDPAVAFCIDCAGG